MSSSAKVKSSGVRRSSRPDADRSDDQRKEKDPLALRQLSTPDDLDTYMEKLYEEDMESKLDGITQILNLSEYGANIEMLVQNEAVLNDEYKKNYDFTLHMMRIFWCYSNFLQLHPILSNYRIGAITLKIVDFEVKRHQLRIEEEKLLQESLVKASHEHPDVLAKLKSEAKKNKKRSKKQDQLLFVCLSVLFNLSEDIHTERKMVKKKIVHFLAKMLDRVTPDLVILTLGFLKKLR
ncbi:hypothetical protein DYB38_011807 [Aphanomyces astaci]|uniref:Condensin complex subunit 1 N-terminal domain-containing protein n=1 Tax=Aphanomyces astaci TaxID=112090 RepID=A0A397DPJ4_APHAT|nr:hypothetical protein DYB38_011807 [Aphanomyces astaci]